MTVHLDRPSVAQIATTEVVGTPLAVTADFSPGGSMLALGMDPGTAATVAKVLQDAAIAAEAMYRTSTNTPGIPADGLAYLGSEATRLRTVYDAYRAAYVEQFGPAPAGPWD